MDSEMVSEHVNRKHSLEGGGGGMPTDTLACCVITHMTLATLPLNSC